ncbi:cysteine hydrolase family protein [Chloroflexota bacterium]
MLVTLEEKVNPSHAALMIIDMQNDFCHSEGAIAKRGRDPSPCQSIVSRLSNIISQARDIGLPIIFTRMVNNNWTQSEVGLEWTMRVFGDKDFMPVKDGTWGAELYQLQPQPQDYVITKHRYSAFLNTDLDVILRSKGIKTLIMTGVTTNVCVESTAREGFMRDYYIVFLKDCTATWDPQDQEATLRNINALFGVVSSSEEIMAAWDKIKPDAIKT